MKKRRLGFLLGLVCLGFDLGVSLSQAASSVADTNTPAPPPLPSIRALRLEPATLTLNGARDERRVLVFGVAEGDKLVDLSSQANFQTASGEVTVGSDGYVRPVSKGKATVLVKAAGREAKLPVEVQDAAGQPVQFVRDVAPVLSKAGCNQGTCHGSAKGKNGFKLSLRGYDPQFDYQALINDLLGRRFNRVNVDESLMLLKPLAEVPHEGRQALKPGSREHQLLRQWILEGTQLEDLEKGRATAIEILGQGVQTRVFVDILRQLAIFLKS